MNTKLLRDNSSIICLLEEMILQPQKYNLGYYIILLFISLNSSMSFCQKPSSDSAITLRSAYKSLSKAEVKQMILQKNFFDKFWNPKGEYKNNFEPEKIEQTRIVHDKATGLIWHASGSLKLMNLNEAMEWISKFNDDEFAGYTDWRLPTLEEAASLLEQKRRKNLYIDPAFHRRQWNMWTGDTLLPNYAWVVVFSGRVDWFDMNVSMNYVRPVRNFQNSKKQITNDK